MPSDLKIDPAARPPAYVVCQRSRRVPFHASSNVRLQARAARGVPFWKPLSRGTGAWRARPLAYAW
jgi:hypothetical protein